MNAPQAGTIKEFLAQEEDTVTVGQDLVRLELGGEAPPKEESKPVEPKKSANEEKATPSDSKPAQKESPSPPAQEQPKKASPPPKQPESKANESKSTSAPGNREERRVSRFVLY